jgi:hypothetical protein
MPAMSTLLKRRAAYCRMMAAVADEEVGGLARKLYEAGVSIRMWRRKGSRVARDMVDWVGERRASGGVGGV